jgi:hypothetical protein
MNLLSNNNAERNHQSHEVHGRHLSAEGLEAVQARTAVRAQALRNLEAAAIGRFPELAPQPVMMPQQIATPVVEIAQPAMNDAVSEAERIVRETYEAMQQEQTNA